MSCENDLVGRDRLINAVIDKNVGEFFIIEEVLCDPWNTLRSAYIQKMVKQTYLCLASIPIRLGSQFFEWRVISS